ncbi:DUF1178 family protein [Sedimentimonas flavescens]|uniref:DUF1178 family protein n=1 Tax=Sedimentimonas flavescens TaxID=2851012 RepID=A0ABT2ZUN9_9RHOB|nr:DUF1178 family protein [Sedimentimonas flavescens]MBW0156768.1 DUF1178 family protein [Sedimentimonas flavescens]MCV2877459.1 DUF1178 family protein [Sedimentimonas flavescens]
MIRYTLKCESDHSFDSWFQSAEAFDKLLAAGMVACSVCGSSKVSKALMAPSVQPARKAGEKPEAPLSAPQGEVEQALAAMRRHVEENSDYVGMNFAAEARAMHDGDAPERAIHGEAKLEEAKALLEDGIPVAPLPFLPRRKTN